MNDRLTSERIVGKAAVRGHDAVDEGLEVLYHLREHDALELQCVQQHADALPPAMLDELERRALLSRNGRRIDLTVSGMRRAEQIVRRHRLAERLLVDVLHMRVEEAEDAACTYEHMVADEVTDSICTLLDHPRTCPHGSPIPPGPCCRRARRRRDSGVVALADVEVGSWVRIAYVKTNDDVYPLTRCGVIPGSLIHVQQCTPALVVMHEDATLAMTEAVARDIFVWHTAGEGRESSATDGA